MFDDEIEEGLRFEAMLNQLGLSMYTDEWAAKVLAYTYYLQGTNEEVVANAAFSFAIRCSLHKLKTGDNGKFYFGLLNLILKHVKELTEQGSSVSWVKEMLQRYNLGAKEE
jgi:hypothetical protein